MKTASIQEIKHELSQVTPDQLAAICIRLARFKKENKELLTYLLFESFDESAYLDGVIKSVEEEFAAINRSNLYFVKKSLRKILRTTSRYIRYSGNPEAEIRLLLHFCRTLKESGIDFEASPVLVNIFTAQLKKTAKAIATLHEDLQYEYLRELKQLE